MTRASADKARFVTGLVGLAMTSILIFSILWAVVAPLVFGWSPIAITSGSMQPHIDAGDLVFIEPSNGQNLQPGAVIVFQDTTAGRVTHRIVDTTPTGDYVTRGDANGRIDSTPVTPDQIIGVGRMVLPSIGHPIVWAANHQWRRLLITAVIAVAAAWAARWAVLPSHNPWRRTLSPGAPSRRTARRRPQQHSPSRS